MSTTTAKLLIYYDFQVDHNVNYSMDIDDALDHLNEESANDITTDEERLFPTDYDMANLAYYAYKDNSNEKNWHNDWRFLLSAKHSGITNGYYGDLFYNIKQRQIVLAHRGTKLSNIGALYTDYRGVYQTKIVPQISTALTFTSLVVELIQKLNQDKETNVFWHLSFTGHSLGGWLAQLSTFYAKYLTVEDGNFIKKDNDGYHAHCVVFDSPGCKQILQKIKDGLQMRHSNSKEMVLKNLDICNYLYSPNLVNSTNLHIGTLLKFASTNVDDVTENISLSSCCCCQYVSLVTHTFNIHAIKLILQCFDKNTGYVKQSECVFEVDKIIDFPAYFNECKDYYTYNQIYKDFAVSKTVQDYKSSQIRYFVVKCYSNVINLNVFSQLEINLLKRFEWSVQVFKYANVVLPQHPDISELVGKLRTLIVDINTRKSYIKCEGFNECQKLIKIIKHSFHCSQHLNEIAKTLTNDVKSVNQIIYKYESSEYIKKFNTLLCSSKEDVSHLKSFFDSRQKMFFLYNKTTSLGMLQVFRTFNSCMHRTQFSKDNYLFISIDKLLSINEQTNKDLAKFAETVKEIKHAYLIVIEINAEIGEREIEFMRSVCNNIGNNEHIKVVVVHSNFTGKFENLMFESFHDLIYDPNLHGDLVVVPLIFQRQSVNNEDIDVPCDFVVKPVTNFVSKFGKDEWQSAIAKQLFSIKSLVFQENDSNECFNFLLSQTDFVTSFSNVDDLITVIDWFIRIDVDVAIIFKTQLGVSNTNLKSIVLQNKSKLILSTLLFSNAENCQKIIDKLDNSDDMGNIYEFVNHFKLFISKNYCNLFSLIESCRGKRINDTAKYLKILSSKNNLNNYDDKLVSWLSKITNNPVFITETCSINSLLMFVEDSIFCLKPVNDARRSFDSIVSQNLSITKKLSTMYEHLITYCV
ncbi:hypothetical protein CHUAL_003282 [Chamberlinius hualienensis]